MCLKRNDEVNFSVFKYSTVTFGAVFPLKATIIKELLHNVALVRQFLPNITNKNHLIIRKTYPIRIPAINNHALKNNVRNNNVPDDFISYLVSK